MHTHTHIQYPNKQTPKLAHLPHASVCSVFRQGAGRTRSSVLLFSRRVAEMYAAAAGYRHWRTRSIANTKQLRLSCLPAVVCSCCLAHILLEVCWKLAKVKLFSVYLRLTVCAIFVLIFQRVSDISNFALLIAASLDLTVCQRLRVLCEVVASTSTAAITHNTK